MSLFNKDMSRKELGLRDNPIHSEGIAEDTLRLVQSSLPIFKKNSKRIAIEMYRRIFQFNESLKSLFSMQFLDSRSVASKCPMAHHGLEEQISAQAQILADSILNFCANVNNISAFEPVLARICSKHVSRQVQPDHYSVVAKCFSEAVRNVIGEQLSETEFEAWDKAVVHLGGLLIQREKFLYKSLETTPGAWQGFRAFRVFKMEDMHGMPTKSVILKPQDNDSLAEYISGQYVCMRAETSDYGIVHRNISLCARMPEDSSTLSLTSYQIRLTVPDEQRAGNECRLRTETIIYEHMKTHGEVQLSAPVGGYVQSSGGGRSHLAGGTYLRRAMAARAAGLRNPGMAASQGARSPLAEVVNDNLASGIAQMKVNNTKGNEVKKLSPMARFAERNGGL